ncbi:MAG: tyrosine-type recombinase/integrase [Hyphomonas sp.]|uniref:tyrosine-type recombinase/integrase n=1 Tax=Hyphomonas sp. TaxID=87 RepID=UPI001AFE11B2|nr:site-specific integrase [Hyphomonas sp.]MBO6581990.1 tyrosine-type recombinase/integrase [Hyphomonas sp.]
MGSTGSKRKSNILTAMLVRNASEPGKYHDGGGTGLYLRVEPNGSRFWVQRVTIKGRRREIGLGSPPVVSLANARDTAIDNKRVIRGGGDPIAERAKAREVLTFDRAIDQYLETKLTEFRNEKHAKQWQSTLDTYARPVLGRLPVSEIEVRHVLRVLEPIWAKKTQTATRLRGRIEAVLSWATVAGFRIGDNPARWKGNLSELLPKPSKVARGDNHPALSLQDAPNWWRNVSTREGIAARAVQFACLTAARSGEVRGMTWSEVDLNQALWIIPAERMKANREHRVPLPGKAIEILKSLPRLKDCEFVFFSSKGGMLSDMALSAVMRRLQHAEEAAGRIGYRDPRSKRPAVPHGLRSTFRDWAAERGYERDLAEIALAHNVGSEVERAYRRTDLLERRRAMLDAWAAFLMNASETNVIPMRGQT